MNERLKLKEQKKEFIRILKVHGWTLHRFKSNVDCKKTVFTKSDKLITVFFQDYNCFQLNSLIHYGVIAEFLSNEDIHSFITNN